MEGHGVHLFVHCNPLAVTGEAKSKAKEQMYAVFRLIVVIHEAEFAGKGRYDIYLPLIFFIHHVSSVLNFGIS